MQQGNGVLMALEIPDTGAAAEPRYYSKSLMCPDSGISYDEPAPHNFSFNSPQGACPHCKGLGYVHHIDLKKIIPDKSLSIYNGAILPLGKYKNTIIFWQIEAILEKYGLKIKQAVSDLPAEALESDVNKDTKERLEHG